MLLAGDGQLPGETCTAVELSGSTSTFRGGPLGTGDQEEEEVRCVEKEVGQAQQLQGHASTHHYP